jgi:hypothetical protein
MKRSPSDDRGGRYVRSKGDNFDGKEDTAPSPKKAWTEEGQGIGSTAMQIEAAQPPSGSAAGRNLRVAFPPAEVFPFSSSSQSSPSPSSSALVASASAPAVCAVSNTSSGPSAADPVQSLRDEIEVGQTECHGVELRARCTLNGIDL